MDIEATQASGVAEPAGEGSPSSLDTSQGTIAAASGSDTPADEFADLAEQFADDPRKEAFLSRLREQSAKLKDQTEQLGRFSQYEGYIPLIQQLQAAVPGLQPEQALAELQRLKAQAQQAAAPPPPDPEQQFVNDLYQRGIDPYALDPNQLALARMTWDSQQRMAQFEAMGKQAQEAAQRAQWQADLQAITSEHAEFGSPLGRDLLLNLYEGRFGEKPNVTQLRALAGEVKGWVKALAQADTARYQQAKAQDAQVPVTVGGTAPNPQTVDNVRDFHRLPDSERSKVISSYLRAHSSQP